MRICLLGEYSGNLDEGIRKISYNLAKELSKHHLVLTLDLRSVFRRAFWTNIKKFNPQIIHYIPGGSPRCFMLLMLISRRCPNAKTIVSVMRFNPFSKHILSLFKPDIVLAQSYEVEGEFKKLGCRTEFLPIGGVDLEKYAPVSITVKNKLREKYAIDKDKFVILHVGSIKSGRNVQLLKNFQEGGDQVVIIGSTSTGIDKKVYRQLKESGCLVLIEYFKQIEEIYTLSDCYVFPVVLKRDFLGRPTADCIDIPLSVLEAMSCNIPVIATKFGALPRIFKEGDGLFFAEREEDFINALNEIRNGVNVKTREKVKFYSWKNIRQKLEEIYSSLIYDEKK